MSVPATPDPRTPVEGAGTAPDYPRPEATGNMGTCSDAKPWDDPVVRHAVLQLVREVEDAHFRTVHDTGGHEKAQVILGAFRGKLGLPYVGAADLPSWNGEAYVAPAGSTLLRECAPEPPPPPPVPKEAAWLSIDEIAQILVHGVPVPAPPTDPGWTVSILPQPARRFAQAIAAASMKKGKKAGVPVAATPATEAPIQRPFAHLSIGKAGWSIGFAHSDLLASPGKGNHELFLRPPPASAPKPEPGMLTIPESTFHQLRVAGRALATIAYNLSQQEALRPEWRESMREGYKEWDVALSQVLGEMKGGE